MSKRMKKIDEDVLENRIIVSLIVIAVLVAISIAYIWISSSVKSKTNLGEEIAKQDLQNQNEEVINGGEENESTESASNLIGKSIEEAEEETNKGTEEKDTKQSGTTSSTSKSNSSVNTTEKNANTQVQEEQITVEEEIPSFIMPVDGEIIKGFSKDNLVFSNTLQEWVTHQALDIKANSRDVVKCSADGKVKSIKNDPRYGLTVIVEHSAGFQTVYSNLLTAEFVVEGEEVKQGQTIGTVGSSAVFEIADESHLHFEILLNSEYVDPSIYLK